LINNVKIKDKNFEIYIESKKIQERVLELAKQIEKDFEKKNPVFIIVLTGSIFFGVDLLKNINFDCNIQMISAKSYGNNMHSSGKVKIENLNLNIKNRHILIIEDIVDTGITINSIINLLKKEEPKSIKVASLLNKPDNRIITAEVDYSGFDIPDKFIVGYGLDYAEYGRNLKDLYILTEE
jgi:hypoxanthine phosphoribosyltransferase